MTFIGQVVRRRIKSKAIVLGLPVVRLVGDPLRMKDLTSFQKRFQREELFSDLIEAAFLAGQIDGSTQTLSYLWLATDDADREH